MALKIMLLTDSDGFPRSFPSSEAFGLEDSWPYLLRAHFKDAVFWQLSYGNATTLELTSQPMGYLTHWKPDLIIVQAGLADCRTEAFSELEKMIISKMTWKFFSRINRYLYHPPLIKVRKVYRVTPGSFRTTIKKFKMVFSTSKIFWLQIVSSPMYEQVRPGTTTRKKQYNEIIKNVYGDGFVETQDRLLEVGGFNSVDHSHQNKNGHKLIADLLIEKISAHLDQKKALL